MSKTVELPRCSATLLRKASRKLTQLYDAALAEEGLTSTQFALLVEIGRHAETPPTLTRLAELMVMDRSGLGHGLRPLEREGLITLREGSADRRQRRIALTASGQAKLQRAERLWSRAENHTRAVLGASALDDLRTRLVEIAHDARLSPTEL